MWLPKDERHLLMAYYVNIFNIDDRNVSRYVDKPKWFVISDWTDVLNKPRWTPILTPLLIQRTARKVKAYADADKTPTKEDKKAEQIKKEVRTHIKLERRLEIANAGLEKRKLINIQKHQSCNGVVGISLMIEGYDLAGKYSSWWTRSGLSFAEYKNHWIWVIVSFLGGIIGGLLINWLSKGD